MPPQTLLMRKKTSSGIKPGSLSNGQGTATLGSTGESKITNLTALQRYQMRQSERAKKRDQNEENSKIDKLLI